MPYDGSGNFIALPPPTYPAVAGQLVRADYFNAVINDIINGLTVTQQSVLSTVTSYAATDGTSKVGFIQLGTGAVARTAQDKLREIYSGGDFGVIGDGVTDMTTKAQNAINAAAAAGRLLEMPEGTIMVSALTLPATLRMKGKGPSTIFKQIAGTTTPMFTISGTTGGVVELYEFDTEQSLITATGSLCDAIKSTATGVANGFPFYLNIHDVGFVNTAYRCLAFYGSNDPTKRQVLNFTRNRCRNGHVDGVNTTYSCIDVHLVDQVDAVIDDNDFTHDTAPTLPGGRGGVVVAQTQTATAYYTKVIISNNRFSYRGVNELASLGAVDCYIWTANTTVVNNVFTNSTATAIKFKGNSYNFSAVNNKIDGYYSTGGALTTYPALSLNSPNYGTTQFNYLIAQNQIYNFNAGAGTGVISIAGYDGVSAFCRNLAVVKNQIYNCVGIGIDLNNCYDVTCSDNDIVAMSQLTNGIRALACDGPVRILRNRISDTTSYHIYNDTPLSASQDTVIEDNQLSGANATYMIYTHCRQAVVRKNFMSGGYHGMNFGGGVQSAIAMENVMLNMTGTVGIAITSTAVNVVVKNNLILDSTTSSFLADSSTPTLKIEENNSWNGQVTWGTAAPASGTWAVKDRRWNTTPNATAVSFWECTAAGTPGTWKSTVLT
jgi:hypothetical protein